MIVTEVGMDDRSGDPTSETLFEKAVFVPLKEALSEELVPVLAQGDTFLTVTMEYTDGSSQEMRCVALWGAENVSDVLLSPTALEQMRPKIVAMLLKYYGRVTYTAVELSMATGTGEVDSPEYVQDEAIAIETVSKIQWVDVTTDLLHAPLILDLNDFTSNRTGGTRWQVKSQEELSVTLQLVGAAKDDPRFSTKMVLTDGSLPPVGSYFIHTQRGEWLWARDETISKVLINTRSDATPANKEHLLIRSASRVFTKAREFFKRSSL